MGIDGLGRPEELCWVWVDAAEGEKLRVARAARGLLRPAWRGPAGPRGTLGRT